MGFWRGLCETRQSVSNDRGDCGIAIKVFDDMLVRSVILWTGLMFGFVRSGSFNE